MAVMTSSPDPIAHTPVAWTSPVPSGAVDKVQNTKYLAANWYADPKLARAADRDAYVSSLRVVYHGYKTFFSDFMAALAVPDPAKTPAAWYIDMKATWDRRTDEIAKRSGEVTKDAKDRIADLNKEVQRLLDVKEGVYSKEIREHIKAMKPAERMSFILRAVDADANDGTVAAVLAAPPFLSGISDEQFGVLRNRRIEKVAAEQLAQIKVIEYGLDVNFHAFNELIAAGSILFPADKINDIAGRINRAKAVRANL